MGNNQALNVKAHLYRNTDAVPSGGSPETRRFTITERTISSYQALEGHVREIFSDLDGHELKLHWKDSDGDYILFSRDNELQDAISGVKTKEKDAVLQIYITAQSPGSGDSPPPQHQSVPSTPPPPYQFLDDMSSTKTGGRSNITSPREDLATFMQVFNDRGRGELNVQGRESPAEGPVHTTVVCDGCQQSPLRGIRYKCSLCRDFDLCSSCKSAGKHYEHPMTAIERPLTPVHNLLQLLADRAAASTAVHTGVMCDGCEMEPLRGTRHHCRVCPNYDLCTACRRAGKHPQHDSAMLQIERPLTLEQRRRLMASHRDQPDDDRLAGLLLMALGASLEDRLKSTDSDSN